MFVYVRMQRFFLLLPAAVDVAGAAAAAAIDLFG